MQQWSGFGIWKYGLAALVATPPALLAAPGLGEETYGVEVLHRRVAEAPRESAPGEAPNVGTEVTQELVVLVIDVPVTSLTLENDRPRPDINVPPWDPNTPSPIKVHGASDEGPSLIRVVGWDPDAPSRIRMHSWSGGTP